ncbi:O-antigen ligase family protein, partial [Bacteroidales bacterium OttesenSCG-928-A17]|nr:O-antigen ligase family protein [Bacteroidales bacterium OttesenSCG-928-A17]
MLLFILGTAIIACGNMMANRLLVCILLCTLSLLVVKEKFNLSIVFFTYLIFLLYLVTRWIYSPAPDYGFRQFVKYLYPFLLMIFASRVPTSGTFYLKALKIILIVAIFGSLNLVLSRTPFRFIIILYDFLLYWGPAVVYFLPVGVVISFALYSYVKKKKYLFYIALFILPSVLWAWRTGILASAIAVVVVSIIRYKLKSVPYVIVGVFILVGSVLFIPQIRDKMFVKQMSTEEILEQRDELSMDDINSNARFAMWDWYLERLYKGNEAQGAGLGVLSYTAKEGLTPFQGGIPHNEYLVILCDTGIVGVVLYGLMFLSLILHSFFVYFNSRYKMIVRLAALIAGGSLAGMASTLYTDNAVTYSLMTLSYPFALYGMMLSLKN